MKYTLEQLECMSDFELNCLVYEYRKGKKLPDGWEDSNWFMKRGNKLHWIDGGGMIGGLTVADYCNSWADMGPLIIRYQISIYSFITYWRCSSLLVKDISLNVDHENPLRAAAIVYILIKQEES